MGLGLPVPPAVLLALVAPTRREEREFPGGMKDLDREAKPDAPESRELEAFLRMNPEERFDIEVVNSIDMQALVRQARGEKRVLREVIRTAEALLPRVRAETEDPVLVGAILRSKTFDWYHRSSSDPGWAATKPLRWGGIFAESREPGGRLSRKLSARLTGLITECVKACGTAAFFRAGFSGLFRGSAVVAAMVPFIKGSKRPRLTQPVAQAYLDDLAASPRNGDQPLPLERLSELARLNGSADVNMTLVELFHQESARALTVLDQRFHPDMCTLIVRVVPPKGPDNSATYDLVQAAHASGDGLEDGGMTEDDPGAYWERTDLTTKEWLEIFRSHEKRKARLEAPPRESKDREPYIGLRNLILSDSVARKAFLVVHWKGRPAGLPLLCRLLSEGTFAPDVETDGDYLEAELDHLDPGHADRKSKDGQWKLGHGWTVVREVASGNLRNYRARTKSTE